MTATLRNETTKYSVMGYLAEAKRLGIRIRLPHVNASGMTFEPERFEDGTVGIRMGLKNVKFIGEKQAAKLMAKRPFKNYAELREAALEKYSGIGARVLSSLN